jgi:RND family efflux transporter MFP subunit
VEEGDLLKELRIDRSQRDEDEGPRRWPWIVAAIALLAVLLAGAGWWALARRATPVDTALAVTAAQADQGSAVLQATGYVTARRQATVSAQITGTLTEVHIEEGEHVKKGQILARLEDKAQKASLDAAEANAAAARAQVGEARAQLAQARRDAGRQHDLVGRGLVSRQVAEQAATQVDTLAAQLNARQKALKAAEAQVALARVNYNYTFVRAPFDGVITAKAAQVGEIVSPLSAGGGFTRTGVGTIVDMNSLEVDVDVNESYIGRVKPGMPAEAVLDAYPDWRIPAHVIAIVPAADRSKATIKVRVALDKKDPRIVPDMGVRVSFLESKATSSAAPLKGVLVPASAVVERDGRSTVFVVADGVTRRHTVQALPASNDMKRIPTGLTAGDRVVVSPPAGLKDGDRVKLKNGS